MGPFDALWNLLGGRESAGGTRGTDESADVALAELGPAEFRARADETAETYDALSLDFTLASLDRLDAFAGRREHPFVEPGEHRGDGAPSMAHGQHVIEFGSYVGEVLANNFDGDWVDAGGWGVAVPVGGTTATVGVFEVAARSFLEEPRFGAVAADVRAGTVPATGTTGLPAGVEAEMAARAEAFATEWPDYDLDGSVPSLTRLDDLVETELADAVEPPDGLGAYLGQAFVRGYDGAWRWAESGDWVVAVDGGPAVLDVRTVLRDRLAGATTFADAHDEFVRRLDGDAPTLAVVAVARRHREAAAALADDHPDLDFSVASLSRLDDVAAASDPPADAPGGGPDGRGPDPGSEAQAGDDGDATGRFGGYFAEVLRRRHGAEWRLDDGEAVLAVAGEVATAELDPADVEAAVRSGSVAFVDVYDRLADEIGLDTGQEAE